MEYRYAKSARKHGISRERIEHVLAVALDSFDEEGGMTMVIGGDAAGNLLEVGYVITDDGERVVIHAMPARRKFLKEW